jgi:glycosyltransferase involved in cell wall biosynthesis
MSTTTIIPQVSVLALILSSGNKELLKRAYQSLAEWQLPQHFLTVRVRIVINTTKPTYAQEVRAEPWAAGLDIVETESNGKPGKGHNSMIDQFKGETDDYCLFLDGDDAYYPCALQQFAKVVEMRPDCVGIMTNDKVMGPWDPEYEGCVGLDHKFGLRTFGDLEQHWWRLLPRENPFVLPVHKVNTPVRLIALSRKGASAPLRYCEKSALFDDFIVFLQLLELQRTGGYKIGLLSNTFLYCYTAMNEDNATSAYRRLNLSDSEEKIFREQLQLTPFPELKEAWNGGKDMPLMCIGKPANYTFENKREFVMTHFVGPLIQDLWKNGNEFYAAEKFDAAQKCYEKLRQTGLKLDAVAMNEGVCLYKTGKLAEAIAVWMTVPVHLRTAMLHKNIGLAFLEMNLHALKYSEFYLKLAAAQETDATTKNALEKQVAELVKKSAAKSTT